jgi:DNA polymerase III sliding clamp (beta) subunit (PCNA family)
MADTTKSTDRSASAKKAWETIRANRAAKAAALAAGEPAPAPAVKTKAPKVKKEKAAQKPRIMPSLPGSTTPILDQYRNYPRNEHGHIVDPDGSSHIGVPAKDGTDGISWIPVDRYADFLKGVPLFQPKVEEDQAPAAMPKPAIEPVEIDGAPATGVSRDRLVYALALAAKVARGGSYTFSKSVLLFARDGALTIRGTNLETEVIVTLPVAGDLAPIVIDPSKLADFVKTKGDMTPVVGLKVEGDVLVVAANGRRFRLSVTSKAEDFPTSTPFKKGCVKRALPLGTFSGAVEYVAPAVCSDITRFNMMRVLFDGNRLVSTDTHRVHVCDGGFEPFGFSPSATLFALRLALQAAKPLDDDREIEMMADKECTLFRIELGEATVEIRERLAEGAFPPYGSVIPKSFEHAYEVVALKVRESLKAGMKVAGKKIGLIALKMNGRLDLTANSVETGNYVESIPLAKTDGTEFEIGVNGVYLHDALLGVELAKIECVDATSPMKISDLAGTRFAIVMPMHL